MWAKPVETEHFANLKAELYWGLRMRFQSGYIAGLGDQRRLRRLVSLRYRHNARGQMVIESKQEARKRGVRSPDRAEALMLAFAPIVPTPQQGAVFFEDRVHISPFSKAHSHGTTRSIVRLPIRRRPEVQSCGVCQRELFR